MVTGTCDRKQNWGRGVAASGVVPLAATAARKYGTDSMNRYDPRARRWAGYAPPARHVGPAKILREQRGESREAAIPTVRRDPRRHRAHHTLRYVPGVCPVIRRKAAMKALVLR
jgi:hypothetical protein